MHIKSLFVSAGIFCLFTAHAQYTHPGNIDSTFGVNGEATTAVNGNVISGISDIKIQADGKIIAGGYYNNNSTSYSRYFGAALARYDAEGNLDNNFGINGIDTLPHAVDSSVSISKLSFQSNGNIVAIAQSSDTNSVVSHIPFVIRFLPDGTIDSSFGTYGKTFFSEYAAYSVYNISVEYDDKIIVTGYPDTHGDYYIARLLSNGSFDPSFGNNGSISGQSFNYPIYECGTVLSNGKILVGGGLKFRYALLVRYNVNGTLDSTFGSNGTDTVTIPGSTNAQINSVALQPDGKMVAAGGATYIVNNAYVQRNFIARYNTNGGLDSGFAVNGVYIDSLSPASNLGFVNIAVQGDGKILAGGGAFSFYPEGYFGLVRHLSNGNFDSSFETNGVVITNTFSDKLATSMQLTNSRIYIAGSDNDPAEWAIEAYVNDAGALPVTLLKFSGTVRGNAALLSWSTANEINNKGFYVQRSTDGMHFSSLGFVGAQYGSSVAGYTYTDNSLSNGNTYYRLKQVDNNGRYTYSNIIRLNLSVFAWSVKGNPVTSNNNSYVQLQLDHTATVSIQVISLDGRIMQTIQKGSLQAGTYNIPLPMNNAVAGIYVVKLMVNDKWYTTKVVKQ